MLFGLFRFDWTILIVIPAFIFSIWAQSKVNADKNGIRIYKGDINNIQDFQHKEA